MVEKGKHYIYVLLTYDPVTFHVNMLGSRLGGTTLHIQMYGE
jgi:hypothetical protein